MPRSIACRSFVPVLAALVLAGLVASCGTSPQPPAEAPRTAAAPPDATPTAEPQAEEPPMAAAPAGEGPTEEAPAEEPRREQTTATEPEAAPVGGAVVVGPEGWSLGARTLASDAMYPPVIPDAFMRARGEISFVAGSGGRAESVREVTMTFASGATMRVSAGGSGGWRCKAPGQTSFAPCTTHEALTIGSDWVPAGATITVEGRMTSMIAGTSITFK